MMSLVKFIVILLSVLGVALPITIFDARDNLGRTMVTNNILQMLEKLRTRMHMDMTNLGISRLDPFTVNEVVLQTEYYKGVPVTMTNITIVGLKSFISNEVNFNMFGMEFHFHFTVPTLKVTGNYQADGILVKIIQFKGKGQFSIDLFNATLKCDGRLINSNNNWSLSDMNFHFAIDELKGGFNQLTDNLVNEILTNSGPKLLTELWPELEPSVNIVAEKIILRQLGHSSLENFINILSYDEIEWPQVEL